MTTYDVGDLVRSTVTFTSFLGVATDPTTIIFKYRNPAGTITSITYPAAGVTKSSTGIYYADVTIDTEGAWWVRWTGTGAIVAAVEEAIQVRHSMFV